MATSIRRERPPAQYPLSTIDAVNFSKIGKLFPITPNIHISEAFVAV
jgi:hypothetical protein